MVLSQFLKRSGVLTFAFVAVACCACGSAEKGLEDVPEGDAVATDAASDVASDGESDLESDVALDVASDVASDAVSDTVSDVAGDAHADDASADTAVDAAQPTDKPFRVAMVSDCHVLPLGLDKKPNKLIVELLQNISNFAAPPAAVFALGDNIEDMFVWYEEAQSGLPIPVLDVLNRIFSENLSVPWYLALGNHDVRFVDTFHELEVPISRWLQYFEGTQHLPARWYSVKMGGFNFVVLFSSDGAIDHETNDTNILLQEQIDWLNGELALGMPTVLIYHIWIEPPLESPEADAETELHPIFQAVIDHPGVVKAAFSGHGHGSRHKKFQGVDFYEVRDAKTADAQDEKASRNDYADVVMDPVAKTVTVANYDDIDWEATP